MVCRSKTPSKSRMKRSTLQTTPDRSTVWMIQTPQVFSYGYRKRSLRDADAGTTDFRDRRCHGRGTDAESSRSRLVYGSYENIKITTPEDLEMAEVFLKRRKK